MTFNVITSLFSQQLLSSVTISTIYLEPATISSRYHTQLDCSFEQDGFSICGPQTSGVTQQVDVVGTKYSYKCSSLVQYLPVSLHSVCLHQWHIFIIATFELVHYCQTITQVVIHMHYYADDTQIRISFDNSSSESSLKTLFQTFSQISIYPLF